MSTTVVTKADELFPLELTPELTVRDVSGLVAAIIEESDRQVVEKDLKDEDLIDEFQMACDGLNSWRIHLRLIEETGQEPLGPTAAKLWRQMTRALAKQREYEPDDFQSVLMATAERARLPWGYNTLRLAYGRSLRNPIRLLHRKLAGAELPTTIAGIALQLDIIQEHKEPILLPVENLRALLSQRKLVVGGALLRLIEHGVLEQTSKRHHTGRAREFRFVGVEGKDYELVTPSDKEDEGEETD